MKENIRYIIAGYIGIDKILIYFLIINIIGFLSMSIDKFKAKKDMWRIPESTLITIALLGGGIGSLAGMYTFRHKTKKMKFTIGIPTILITEMYERGIKFLPIDLYKSHSTKFIMEDEGIRPPLNSIPGLGTIAAEGIYNARLEEPFECIEDMQSRAKIGKSVTELLDKFGCLKGMTKSNQMSLFV